MDLMGGLVLVLSGKGIRRNTGCVKMMKKLRAYFIPAINSQIIHL